MLGRDDKGKGEAPKSDQPVINKTDAKVQGMLRNTHAIKAEVDQIHSALNEPHIEDMGRIEAGITDLTNNILRLNDEANAIKEHKLQTAQQQLADAKKLQIAIMQDLTNARDKLTAARDEGKDVEWEEDEIEWDEDEVDDLPPPPVNLHPAALPEDFFFAHNQAEYEARRNLVKPLHDNFAATNEKVRRMTQQTKSLKFSATTAAARQKLTDQINAELLLLKQYKGFLDDLARRHQNIHAAHGQVRDVTFNERPDISADTTHEDQVRLIAEKIAHVNQHIATLNAAKTRVSKEKAVNPQKSVFYSKLDNNQVFAEADLAANISNATQAAYQFLGSRLQQQQAGAPDRLVGLVGIQEMFTPANHTCRFIGTEVATKANKPAIPVAFVQETNTQKTFSKQTMLLAPGHLKELDKLPFLTRDKIAKIKEQMKFVANTIETSMASITTNGPISLDYWPKNLGKAAAVYCNLMGYDLHPKQFLNDIKPEELVTLTRAFTAQIDEDATLKKLMDEATARRDVKAAAEAPRPD